MTPVSIDDILAATEKITRVSLAAMKKKGPWPATRKPRLYFYFVAVDCFAHNPFEVARALSRDTGTVREALTKVRSKCILNPDVIDAIEDEALRLAALRAPSLQEAA